MEMSWVPIKKTSEPCCVQPHLLDYAKTCAGFAWDKIRHELDGLPGGQGLNIAHEAVDRHTEGPRRDQPAIRWLGQDGTILVLTYANLKVQTNRFANVLAKLGVDKGDRVFTLTGKIPELYIAAIGAWKQVAVFCPLFSAFGPEPIYQRLHKGDAKVLVTTKRLYRQKVAELRERLPQLTHVLLTDAEEKHERRRLVAAPMHGPSLRQVCDPAHQPGGDGDFAFYQRYHRNAQGSRPCA